MDKYTRDYYNQEYKRYKTVCQNARRVGVPIRQLPFNVFSRKSPTEIKTINKAMKRATTKAKREAEMANILDPNQ